MLFFALYCYMQYVTETKTKYLTHRSNFNRQSEINYPSGLCCPVSGAHSRKLPAHLPGELAAAPGHVVPQKQENIIKPVKFNRGMVVDHPRSPVLNNFIKKEENMKFNQISAEVPHEKELEVIQHIKDARASLDFLVNLNSDQRIRMSKLSRKRVDFVDTSLVYVKANPEYLPAYINMEEFVKDVELKDCLHRIMAELYAFAERVSDTTLQVESEAYRAARLYYKSVKAAAREGTEDAERIARALAYHHKGQGPPKNGDVDEDEQVEEVA